MEPGYFSISSHPGKDVSITRHPRQEAGALGPRLCLARPPHHPSELQPCNCALTSDPTPLVGLALPHPSPGQPRGSHPHTILIQTPRLTQACLWPPDTHGHHPSCPASVSASACGYTQPPPPHLLSVKRVLPGPRVTAGWSSFWDTGRPRLPRARRSAVFTLAQRFPAWRPESLPAALGSPSPASPCAARMCDPLRPRPFLSAPSWGPDEESPGQGLPTAVMCRKCLADARG